MKGTDRKNFIGLALKDRYFKGFPEKDRKLDEITRGKEKSRIDHEFGSGIETGAY